MHVLLIALMPWISLLTGTAATAAPRAPDAPERIESLRKRILTPERYRQLRDEWAAYAKAHPNEPEAWVQLARAANYANDSCETVARYSERAYRVGPRNAQALATYGGWQFYCDIVPKDPDEAIRLLDQALELDPTLEDARIRLWVLRLSKGQTAVADAHLVWLLDHGNFPEPLVDFGYNLLVDLEPNAMLLTNGDNDTVPLVALQAGRGFRRDVTVVNLSMLELGWYRRWLRESRKVPVPLLAETPTTGSNRAVAGLIDQLKTSGSRPLYTACTVNQEAHPIPAGMSLEGIVYRVLPGQTQDRQVDAQRMERNLDSRYRLESATSPGLDWDAWSSIRQLMTNYAAAEMQLATAQAHSGKVSEAGSRMNRALELGEFHHSTYLGMLVDQWSSWDPDSRELAEWKRKLKR